MVIVAQRVSTIRDADRIVVLDEGQVVGTGSHHELMDGNETYREIVLSQLTESGGRLMAAGRAGRDDGGARPSGPWTSRGPGKRLLRRFAPGEVARCG